MSISIYNGSSPSIVQACTEARGRDSEELCADALISKLNGANENEKKNALDYITSHKIYDKRFIPSLINLSRSGNFELFEKSTTLLLLYKQNNVSFSLDQEATFLSRLNGAKVSLENGGLRVEGANFVLPNGKLLQSGALYFKEGRIFVPAGGTAVVENIEVDAKSISSRYSFSNHFAWLGQVYHYLNDYSLPMKESLRQIKIVDSSQVVKICGKDTVSCCIDGQNVIISTNKVGGQIVSSNLVHETAHALTNVIGERGFNAVENFEAELKNKYFLNDLTLYYDASGRGINRREEGKSWLVKGEAFSITEDGEIKYWHVYVPEEPEEDRALAEKMNEKKINWLHLSEEDKAKWLQLKLTENHNPFTETWVNIAGDIYGNDLGPKDVADGILSAKWADGTSGPRHGCVRAYGANNYHEDIATFVENCYSDPEFFQREGLLDPGSPAYDPRYQQKLQLLKEYGFIDEARFNLIVGSSS